MLEAVIFDFDGVILDTSDQLYHGYKRIFKRYGVKYLEEQFNENYGLKTKEHFNKVLLENNITLSDEKLDELVAERDINYRKDCSVDLEPLPGTVELLTDLSDHNIKLGVASSTSRDNLDFFLPKIGVESYFNFTLAGTEVSSGKPNPEIYSRICEHLNVDPKSCIGIEDTDKGIAALKNAGMKAIAVTLTNRKKYDFSKADLVVYSLEELNLDKLSSII
jgi:HAD superfamily hydrolase (TIGR01509 family)